MRKLSLALSLVFVGCAGPQYKIVKIDSDPQGARVFMARGINATTKFFGRDYLGNTPLDWKARVARDGTIYRSEDSAFVFVAEFVDTNGNLLTDRQLFRGDGHWGDGDQVPNGIFFDLRHTLSGTKR